MILQGMDIYLMRRKYEGFEKFKEYMIEMETRLGKYIKALYLIVMANTC